MSVAELAGLVGRSGLLDLTSDRVALSVAVVIHDAREVFGRRDVLIEPVAGRGRAWVALDRVRLSE